MIREANPVLLRHSGTNFNRPGFKAMMNDVNAGKINCIIVKDLSRFGRNLTEVGRYIDEIFPTIGIRFISIGDNYDSNDIEFSGMEFALPFLNLMYEMYSRDVAYKAGRFIGTIPPYGYKRDSQDKHHFIIDEDNAPTVREIFDLKMSGLNATQIAKYLNDSGIETPMQRMLRFLHFEKYIDPETTSWSAWVVQRMLTDESYLGSVVQGKTRKPNFKTEKCLRNAKSDWVVVPGMHEPIISRDIFDYVQDLCGRIMACSPKKGRVYTLAGFVRCGKCGTSVTVRTGNGNLYYVCTSFIRKEGCQGIRIRIDRLESIVLGEIRVHIEHLLCAKKKLLKSGGEFVRKRSIAEVDKELKELFDKEIELMELKTKIYEDVNNGIIAQESCRYLELYCEENIQKTQEEIQSLKKKTGQVANRRR